MKFKKQNYGGARPIMTGSPHQGVIGGFNLDQSVATFGQGAVIPGGSLAEYDEAVRLVTVLKASRVKAIDAVDAKIVTLDTDFIPSTFRQGDRVTNEDTPAGTFTSKPTIVSVEDAGANTVIVLSAAISGLAVGDALYQIVNSGGNAAFAVTEPQGLTLNGDVTGTEVSGNYVSVDVTTDTHGYAFYTRRIPPIPAQFRSGNHLAGNANVLLTDSR
jgi:hypothetical protein